MLGYFGGLIYQTQENIQEILLEETLQVLQECKPDALILLRPHMISDLEVVNNIINKFAGLKIFITYLPPVILATQSKFVIANDYTTSLNDFKIMGVPTIEYASYNNKCLEMTSGKSMRPEYVDYFINKNKLLLTETMKNLLFKKRDAKLNVSSSNKDNVFNRILNL